MLVPGQRVGVEGDELLTAASHQSPTRLPPTLTVAGGLPGKLGVHYGNAA